MDLSLSVRFANLAQGSKLTLTRTTAVSDSQLAASPPAIVSVALQLEDGVRLMGKFKSDTPVWSVLAFFEEESKGCVLSRSCRGVVKGLPLTVCVIREGCD